MDAHCPLKLLTIVTQKMRSIVFHLGSSLIALVSAISISDGTLDKTQEVAQVHEVREGDVAVLPCPSHDGLNRFLFWQIDPNIIIGPEHPVNKTKYKYEVLTGTLKIRDVRQEEAGVYRCASQSLNDQVFSIRPVQLVVNKNWEEVWEADHETNLVRGWIAFLVVGILLVGAYFAYRYRKRPTSRFREIPDEDVPEDSLTGVELTAPSTSLIGGDGDNTSLVDTDFPKSFNAMYKPVGGVEARL
ncbi:uncharacterized protein LOC124162057 isoform X2 [Ischnura elegans]|uniref:uncharacterized protein LOC124162057 isoform X2 n=1 Tax=Ischnura elegans TaxID=197161 RepID=UPI001ED8B232|nr:uncharacterized protein LOC124162057 isoform X2 [Ischnura elegans]